jgi:hypothetical protein
MKSRRSINKTYPRPDGPLTISGLAPELLEQFRRTTGYKGKPDRNFFETHVWWWRPLIDILGPKHRDTKIPDAKERTFLPENMFRVIRHAEEIREVPELIRQWVLYELGARLSGASPRSWPAFILRNEWLQDAKVDWSGQFIKELSLRVDLRESDGVLVANFKKALHDLRSKSIDPEFYPNVGKVPKKSAYITLPSFSILEKIDEKFSLKNSRIDHDHLGNARKIIAANEDFLRLWLLV